MGLVITDATTIKAFLGDEAAGSELDAQLTLAATQVSSAMEGPELLGRELQELARTEVYFIPEMKTRRILTLRNAPVDSGETFTVKTDEQADWANTTAISSDRYVLSPETGVLRFTTPIKGPMHVQVVYTGGFAADLVSFIAAYPDLHYAATQWAAQVWQRRAQIDSTSESRSGPVGVSTKYTSELGKVPMIVKTTCAKYRRVAA